MARRRMFNKDIIQSMRFVTLSPEAQALYLHLGVAADDDGIVEAYAALMLTGAGCEVLDELEDSGFIRVLNREMVVHIVHWKEHNSVRKDRYTPSRYLYLLQNDDDNQMATNCQPIDNQMATQYRVGEDRLGQVSVGEDRGAGGASLPYPPSRQDVERYARAHGLTVDCGKFHEYYQQREWRQSNGKALKQWGLRLERWAQSEYNRPTGARESADSSAERNREEMRALARRLKAENEQEDET